MTDVEEIEKRFCEITKLEPKILKQKVEIHTDKEIEKLGEQQQEIIKELSKIYGFVPTPIYLVDKMIALSSSNFTATSKTYDSCAGCGQYSIRLLKYFCDNFKISAKEFLSRHYFNELQPRNCAALVYIFGKDINLFVGNSMDLHYGKSNNEHIMFLKENNTWGARGEVTKNINNAYETYINKLQDAKDEDEKEKSGKEYFSDLLNIFTEVEKKIEEDKKKEFS